MRKMLSLIAMISVSIVCGCAGKGDLLKNTTDGKQQGVYQVISGSTSSMAGYADLRISSSIKTHRAGVYLIEKAKHGTAGYNMVVSIDGQSLSSEGEIQEETTSYLGERNPEAGEGVRYQFVKTLRLKPGTHTIVVSFPDDNVTMNKEIFLEEGSNNIIVEPIYKRRKPYKKIGYVGDTTFYEGLKGLRLILNNKPL